LGVAAALLSVDGQTIGGLSKKNEGFGNFYRDGHGFWVCDTTIPRLSRGNREVNLIMGFGCKSGQNYTCPTGFLRP
jgi:hypothetical protein